MPFNAENVTVDGTKAYVADGPGGLRIVDVTPGRTGRVGLVRRASRRVDVAVRDGIAYVAFGRNSGAADH